jgi:hypothetical protein
MKKNFATLILIFSILLLPAFSAAAVKDKDSKSSKQKAKTEQLVKSKAPKKEVKKSIKKNYNCSDFVSQKDAQVFYLEQGGPKKDPHRLDADKDGVACETLR